MKSILKLSPWILLLTAGADVFAQPVKKPDDKSSQPVHSSFNVPASAHEGHDPFFPESSRLYETAVATHAAEITTLTVRGFSGTPGNRMVIINNHTFGVGDEGDVLTPSGRIHVRCLEINPNGVVIEANSQRRELNFSTQ
jgi:hypothetical protein